MTVPFRQTAAASADLVHGRRTLGIAGLAALATYLGLDDLVPAGRWPSLGEAAQAAGAIRFRYADTLGILDPFSTHERIARLRSVCDLDLEIHAHNDLGLATANTLAAVRAGATHISTTVNGLGERAGNAPLEEAVMALRHLYNIDTGVDSRQLPVISELVATASARPLSPGKPIVGGWVFTHEAGIHVDGLIKDAANYQGFDPAELGRAHQLVLGKHSGTAAVLAAGRAAGLELDPLVAPQVLERLRHHAATTKRPAAVSEFWRLQLESHPLPPDGVTQ